MKRKKNHITLFLLLIFNTINAQTNYVTEIPPVDSTFSTKLTGAYFFEKKQYIGSQFFNIEWVQGNILLTNKEIVQCKSLKYNGLLDELIWLNTCNFGQFKLDKSFIDEFKLKDKADHEVHFKKISIPDSSKNLIKTIFLQVAVEGKLSLYIERSISSQRYEDMIIDNVRCRYSVLKPTPTYYLKISSNKFLIMNKLQRRSFLKLFPEKQKSIIQIMKDNKLEINNESDFINLIRLINKNGVL